MSRVGKNPVAVPDGVTVEIIDSILNVKGKLGQQSFTISAVSYTHLTLPTKRIV